MSLIFSVGLFILLPTVLVGWLKKFIVSAPVLSLCEGGVRIVIFLAYLFLVSRMKDIQRVFEYHGAEHKTIAAYEHGEELTPENARKYSRLHPRCGTSFLLIVMIISIIFFSFLKWETVWQRMLYRLLLLPVVAGVSYEIIKFAGRSDSKLVKWLTSPVLHFSSSPRESPTTASLKLPSRRSKAF